MMVIPKQKIPLLDFDEFTLGEIKPLFDEGKIFINPDYQRGNIWKLNQKRELIKTIENSYSMGVLVLCVNDRKQFEILDGQQRLLTILDYVNGVLDLQNSDITPYADLPRGTRNHINSYCVYYLKLAGYSEKTRDVDIVQTFLRLQEGTPLNKAEKISAYSGAFKDAFREARDKHVLFSVIGGDKRFRLRLLAAEMLLLELEGDFDDNVFPSLELRNFIWAIDKYKEKISARKLTFFKGNVDMLYGSLSCFLSALKPRELLSFYLLISYLRKRKTGNKNLINEISAFAKEFLKNLYSFGIYDNKPPKGMSMAIFTKYRAYKFEAKVMTTPKSIRERLEMITGEFKRLKPFVEKDPNRYHDEEQKRDLFFRQKGLCGFCKNPMLFRQSSGDHMILHSKGGRTDDLANSQLLHVKCHQRLEKEREQARETS